MSFAARPSAPPAVILFRGALFGAGKHRLHNCDRLLMQLFRTRPVHAAGDTLRHDVAVRADGPVDGEEVIDAREHQGSALLPEHLVQAFVDLAEVPFQRFLVLLARASAAVEDAGAGAGGAKTHRAHLKVRRLRLGRRLSFGKAGGHAGRQFDFPRRVPAALEQPHRIAAEREHIEAAVPGEKREQRLDVEAVAHHGKFLESEAEAGNGACNRRSGTGRGRRPGAARSRSRRPARAAGSRSSASAGGRREYASRRRSASRSWFLKRMGFCSVSTAARSVGI